MLTSFVQGISRFSFNPHGTDSTRAGRNTAESHPYVHSGVCALPVPGARIFPAARAGFAETSRSYRRRAQAGRRKLEKAAAKTAEYEAALRAARGEIYRELDQWRRELQTERATAMDQARREADARIGEAKEELAGEVANLRRTLAGESDALAAQIADSILRRRAA